MTVLRVNIGAGSRPKQGYENIDVRPLPGIRRVDLRRRFPYANASIREFLAEDVLEHFRRAELEKHVLPEIYRCLAPGGVLVLQMPDLHEMVRQWQAGRVTDEIMSLRIHGRQDYPENTHYASYTKDSMTRLLRQIGFANVRHAATRQWNMVLHATKAQ